ncbi:hypothetical protein QBC35DRAFT_166459 [Podospora australis]|uniref:Uncharacterized protein n=1 Tax=Podospora australis TaxID=1536484 RepID=A0AAN7AKS8_9PEZI|nr:hypothetical protein QBC35DRAFT_166459 [Podospora australis]
MVPITTDRARDSGNMGATRGFMWECRYCLWCRYLLWESTVRRLYSNLERQLSTLLDKVRCLDMVFKTTLGFVAFILTCVGVWAAVRSALDPTKATALAEWQSTKEFIDFCEAHASGTPNCLKAQNVTLAPPPGFPFSRWRRSLWSHFSRSEVEKSPTFTKMALVLIVLGISFFIVLEAFILRSFSVRIRIAQTVRRALKQARRLYKWQQNLTDLPSYSKARQSQPSNVDGFDHHGQSNARSRKSTARRRRSDRFSRYRATDNSGPQLDDTSDDELYTHGAKRERTRIRRRVKKVSNDEKV